MGVSVLPRQMKWPLYLLAAFPISDYFLHIYPWGIIGGFWDKLLLIFFAVFVIRAYFLGDRRTLLQPQKMVVFVAVLGLVYVLMDTGYLEVALAGYRVDYMYMLFMLMFPYIVEKEDVIPLLKFMVFAGFLVAVHGVYEYVVKVPIPAAWLNLGEHERTRVYSVFGSPNIMGSYMAFIAPTAFGFALYEKHRGKRWFYILASVFTVMSLVFSFTRGAWFAFFIGALIFTWLIDKRLTVVALIVGVAAVFFVPPIHARIAQFLSTVYWAKTIASGRIARWTNAYDQMRNNPFFGAGLGRYGGAVASRFFGVIYVDNYYAKTLAETGLLGLISYLGLLFVYLRAVYKAIKTYFKTPLGYVFIGVFSSLIVLVAHNFVENIFEVPSMNYLFWFAGSVVLIYTKGAAESE